jgi:hypothetical protein
MGSVLVPDELQHGELVAFRPSSTAIEFEAQSDADVVLGSAVPHDYDLVLGSDSVHTSSGAIAQGYTSPFILDVLAPAPDVADRDLSLSREKTDAQEYRSRRR